MSLDPQLLTAAAEVEAQYAPPHDDPWQNSPFRFLRTLPSRSRGAAAEAIVERWATARGLEVRRPGSTHYDRVINGHRVEIKMSTLWSNGVYRFQQIRNQDYDHVLCLGISPRTVHAWLAPKPVLATHVIGVLGQHTGADGTDTAWFAVTPHDPPDWLAPYGPTLDRVANLLTQAPAAP